MIKKHAPYAILVVIFVLCIVIIYFTPRIIAGWGNYSKWPESPGEFGDQYGLTNSIFSMLAFISFGIALYMQRQELALQRTELAENREVLKKQALHLGEQAAEAVSQREDAMYFELMRFMQNACAAVEYRESHSAIVYGNGMHAVGKYAKNLKDTFHANNWNHRRSDEGLASLDIGRQKIVLYWYNQDNEWRRHVLGPYLGSVMAVLWFIKTASEKRKRFYLDTFKKYIGKQTIVIMWYCGMACSEEDVMYELANAYGLFQMLAKSDYAHSIDYDRQLSMELKSDR